MPQKKSKTDVGKKTRRGNKEGSIFFRKDRKRWVGQAITGFKADGSYDRKSVYGKTREEVAHKISVMTAEVFNNGYTNVSDKKERNFQVLMQEWFEVHGAVGVKSNVEETRRGFMKNHIFKALGKFDVEKVTYDEIQKFFNKKLKDKMALDSIYKMRDMLRSYFKYAVKFGFVKENPMDEIKIPTRKSNEANKKKGIALRKEIRGQVLDWAAENPIFKPIVFTLMFTGLRPQELIALEWKHIDLGRKILYVEQALKRVSVFDELGNVIDRYEEIGETKTPNSVRSIRMSDTLLDAIVEWKDYCARNKINSKYVFPNTENGELRTYSGLVSMLDRFIKRHKLQAEKISLYTFRHTFATMLLEKRENPKIVSKLMGHSKVSTTLDLYSHVMSDEVYEETAQTLDGLFEEYTAKPPLSSGNDSELALVIAAVS